MSRYNGVYFDSIPKPCTTQSLLVGAGERSEPSERSSPREHSERAKRREPEAPKLNARQALSRQAC